MTGIDPVQEQHYNVRAAIPEHMAVFADWRHHSQAYAAACPDARLDIPYGESPDETLDYFPADEPNAPQVLLIHGGYWQALDKADNGFAAEALNAAGIGVAVVNYSLCPTVTLDVIVQQMQRATLWLWRHAGELGADPGRLHVIGHSAGGHLAAMLLTTKWSDLDADAPVDLIKGAVAISGLFDLRPIVATSINHKLGLDADSALALSPVNHRPVSETPLLLAVGGDESQGFHNQVQQLQAAWPGMPIHSLVLAGCHHLQVFEALADPESPLLRDTLTLIQHSQRD